MFDIDAHQRERLRRLERDNTALREQRDTLFRLIAFLLQEWFRDTDVDPCEYLQVVVDCHRMLNELAA